MAGQQAVTRPGSSSNGAADGQRTVAAACGRATAGWEEQQHAHRCGTGSVSDDKADNEIRKEGKKKRRKRKKEGRRKRKKN